MKRQLRILMLVVPVSMAGCSLLQAGGNNTSPAASTATSGIESVKNAHATDAPADRVVIEDKNGRVEVQRVEFHSGVSSTTVERLAKRYGCTGRTGAGLLTEKGPVEVYRMQCDNGTVFMARCELRQCRPMH